MRITPEQPWYNFRLRKPELNKLIRARSMKGYEGSVIVYSSNKLVFNHNKGTFVVKYWQYHENNT